MSKIIWIFIGIMLCGCSLKFDPAGGLGAKKSTPTGTTIPTSMLEVKRAAASPANEIKCTVKGDLNLRAQPNASAPVVDWLLTGETVVVTGGEVGGWRSVRNWARAQGYASAKWLECEK